MAKAIRLKNNDYINSDSVAHKRKLLSNILENEYHIKSKNIGLNSWYRIAKIKDRQVNLLLFLSTLYNYTPPSSMLLSILTIYQNAKISQLNAVKFHPNVTPSITKVRVQYDYDTRIHYVDIYYTPNQPNELSIKCENKNDLDYIEILDPVIVSTEYTTLDEITISY